MNVTAGVMNTNVNKSIVRRKYHMYGTNTYYLLIDFTCVASISAFHEFNGAAINDSRRGCRGR